MSIACTVLSSSSVRLASSNSDAIGPGIVLKSRKEIAEIATAAMTQYFSMALTLLLFQVPQL